MPQHRITGLIINRILVITTHSILSSQNFYAIIHPKAFIVNGIFKTNPHILSKKRHHFWWSCVLALPIFTARTSYRHAVATVRWTVAGISEPLYYISKNLHPNGWRLNMFALPIFTASHPATIVGVRVLNFCVRDGNRWTHTTINTNLFTLVTHTGFEPMLTA